MMLLYFMRLTDNIRTTMSATHFRAESRGFPMSTAVVALALPTPSKPWDALQSERASIVADLETAGRVCERLAEAQKNEERIFAEIAKLGEKEIEVVKAWVASGCEGPQPQPDAGERARLTKRMAAAVDAARTAKAVASEVETEANGLRARLANLDEEIRALKIVSLENQFDDSISKFSALSDKMRSVLLEIRALPVALLSIGRLALDRGEDAYARTCFATAEKMRNRLLPGIEPSDAELGGAVARVSGRIVSGVDTPIAPTLSREALLAAAATSNQAQNKLQFVADDKS